MGDLALCEADQDDSLCTALAVAAYFQLGKAEAEADDVAEAVGTVVGRGARRGLS